MNLNIFINPETIFIDGIILCLEQTLKKLSYSNQDIFEIKISLAEALNNSIQHGYFETGNQVNLNVNVDKELIEIELRNPIEDPLILNQLKNKLPSDPFQEHGRGVFLMYQYMDFINYDVDHKTLVLKMTKTKTQNES